MWKALSENIKLVITSVSVATAVLGGLFTAYTWYHEVSDIVEDYPKLQDKVKILEEKINSKDTLNTPFITKQAFERYLRKNETEFNSIFYYKWPYGQWGNPNSTHIIHSTETSTTGN